MKENIFKINKWPVIGHTHIISALQNNIKNKLVNHAYLFVGPRGIGKKLTAQYFTKTLFCENIARPCDNCRDCKSVDSKSAADYICIGGNDKRIKIEQIRNIIHKLSLTSNKKYKICIIDGADELTNEAANAALKLLEEPKGKVVFILIAKSLEKILPTIISRCITYRFGLVSNELIEGFIGQNAKELDKNKISIATNIAAGRPGIANDLILKKENFEEINDTLNQINNIIKLNYSQSFKLIGEWVHYEDLKFNKLDILLQLMRDVYQYKIGCENNIIFINDKDKISKLASIYSLNKLSSILSAVIKAKEMIIKNSNRKLVLENIALSIKNA